MHYAKRCRCAEFFLQHGQHEQAVRLFISGRQQQRALDLILECDVPMSDDMAEALTPEKTPDNAEDRAAVLMRIAQVHHVVACMLVCD